MKVLLAVRLPAFFWKLVLWELKGPPPEVTEAGISLLESLVSDPCLTREDWYMKVYYSYCYWFSLFELCFITDEGVLGSSWDCNDVLDLLESGSFFNFHSYSMRSKHAFTSCVSSLLNAYNCLSRVGFESFTLLICLATLTHACAITDALNLLLIE